MSQAASSNRRPLLRAADVCEIAKVQPYVLRSWEKEFPNLGVSKSGDGPRFYRRADLDEVLRIKQLVFGEGLTIAGARRKLEEERAATTDELPFEEVEDEAARGALPRRTRTQLDRIRRGLKSILELLDRNQPRTAAPRNGHETPRQPAAAKPPRKAADRGAKRPRARA